MAGSTTPDPVSRRSGLLWMAVATAVVVASRLWATAWSRFPYISADEPAYLSMARLLAGNGGWNLGRAGTYGPGYSLLIAPWSAAGLSPDTQYRAAILTNVVLAAAAFWVLEAVLRRLTDLDRPRSVLAALTGSLTPSLLLLAGYAWSDTLSVLALLVVVWTGVHLIDRPGRRSALLTAAAATAAYAVHGRFAPVAILLLGAFAVLAWRRVLPTVDAATGAVALAAGLVAVHVAESAIYARLYEPGGQERATTGELGRALKVWPATLSSSGQLWYLLVTTAGVAGLGALALITAAAWGRRGTPRGVRTDAAAVLTVAVVTVAFLTSAAFMADRPRADHLIYGRYNDALVGLLIGVGLARLVSGGDVRARLVDGAVVLAATVGSGALILATRSELLEEAYNGITIRSLLAIGGGGTRRVLLATGVGAVLVVVVTVVGLAGRRRPTAVLGVLLALAAVGTVRGTAAAVGPRDHDPSAAASLQHVVGSTDHVAFVVDPAVSKQGFFRYPFYAPDLHLYRTEDPVWQDGVRWIMAPADRTDIAAAGYELVWVDPEARQALWRRVS